MFCGALRVFFVLNLVSIALGFSPRDFEGLEEWRRAVGGPAPATPHTPGTTDVCKKDILILLDTSYSIGRHHFDSAVKPFLKKLVKSSKLNVGPDGTQLALATFSNAVNTRLRFGFGIHTMVKDYVDYIDKKLIWSKVSGDRTMTGVGATIADTQVFPQESPLNARPNIADVVLLITDGKPNGRKKCCELEDALRHTSSMKNRSILIVGIAMGQPKIRKQFNDTLLKMVTSSSTLFNSDFIDLDKILDQLVDASCTPFKPGDCDCPTIQSQDVYIKPSQSTVDVSWVQPNLKCRKDRVPKFAATTVNPNIVSPHAFGVGDHDIEYTYTFRGGFDLKCHVKIAVKSCTCPSSLAPVVAYVSSDQGSVTAQWVAPVPSCGATLKDIQPNKPSGSSFTLGSHTVNYVYATAGGFDLTCGINIQVRKCSCQNTRKSVYMMPDSPNGKMSVNWVVPKPVCPGQQITRTLTQPLNMKPGASVGVGNHVVWYYYGMSSGVNVQCSATVVVRVVPCAGVDYDPATHMCCCGKIHSIKSAYKCCGRKQYDSRRDKCCTLNYNIVGKLSSCPGGGSIAV